MKETIKLLQRMGKILTAGIVLVLLAGCENGAFEPGGGAGGNVTITIGTDAGTAGRTVRPNDITNASIFDRIAVEFTKDGFIQTLTLTKPQTSGTINLESGTWSISALGFIVINGREYEAARGSSSVTVTTGSAAASISLQTGIFSGSPGVFNYNIDYPAGVTEAVLAITPLDDLRGYPTTNTGNTVNLIQGKSGSFDLLPGYYILNITAKTGANTMAIWNELAHIYSGLETAASHTFNAADFTGAVTLSGIVAGGELEGNHITGAVVTAYADANYINRIASVPVPDFTKMAASPFYHAGLWSMIVPSSFAGRDVYFQVEETLNGPAGTKYHISDSNAFTVSVNGNTGIELGASFTWWKWLESGDNNDVTFTVGQDGTVSITTHKTVENEWDGWRQLVAVNYPAENDLRYAYEFEAWTSSGERPLSVQYIERHVSNTYLNKGFSINTTKQSFVILSETRIDPNVNRNLGFQVGHTTTGTLHIKLKSIKRADDYTPLDYDDQPRFTATATDTGIHLKADYRGLPMGINGVMFKNETVGDTFEAYWNDPDLCPDTYEMIYPYVEPNKDYVFSLTWQGDSRMVNPTVTVKATHGRGEFKFSNASELALLLNGNMLGYNKAPDINAFTAANSDQMVNPQYRYCIVSGASWGDPAAIWRYYTSKSGPESVDITDLQNIPPWAENLSEFMGKTCFATSDFCFDYNDDDIYPVPDTQKGVFYTAIISTPPFIHPNAITGALTAAPHTEGVKLTVDLEKISPLTESMDFHIVNWVGARLWMGADSWKEYWGEFYGQNKVEIVFPFVTPGKTYTFEVEFGGTGTVGRATITATSGLGEMVISNLENIGLLYNRNTKTMTSSAMPTEPTIAASPKITRKYWQWQFYAGINWDMQEWMGALDRNSQIMSVIFNETFNPALGARLSERPAFVSSLYRIVYDGHDFTAQAALESPSFTFPHFDPAGYGIVSITTAFDTNSDLYLDYYDTIYPGSSLSVYVRDQRWYDDDEQPVRTLAWYINGVLVSQGDYTDDWTYLTIPELDPGLYYGLVVVTIDGTAFAREFAFRVIGN
jgi:hypothetical protein